jgi:hypothetical protein
MAGELAGSDVVRYGFPHTDGTRAVCRDGTAVLDTVGEGVEPCQDVRATAVEYYVSYDRQSLQGCTAFL